MDTCLFHQKSEHAQSAITIWIYSRLSPCLKSSTSNNVLHLQVSPRQCMRFTQKVTCCLCMPSLLVSIFNSLKEKQKAEESFYHTRCASIVYHRDTCLLCPCPELSSHTPPLILERMSPRRAPLNSVQSF